MKTAKDNEDSQSWGNAIWRVQPRWLKTLTLTVMLPCWLVMVASVLSGSVPEAYFNVAVAIFVAIGAMELIVVAKAYWQHEI